MAHFQKLKNQARREEQRGRWVQAIELYKQAIRFEEDSGATSVDFGLYNRVGDLYLRQGDTAKEFGQQFITLDRDLHRWLASFQFARSPNGNVLFQVILQLKDAPELKIDYDQRTDPPTR